MSKFSKLLSLLLLISISLSFNGCGGAKLTPAAKQAFATKQTMYAQRNMHFMYGSYAKKIVNVSNYSQGTMIPVNSKITLKDVNARQFSFHYNGQVYVLLNNVKYSGLDISGVLNRYFSEKPVDLSKFTATERKVIAKPEGTKSPVTYIPSAFVPRSIGGWGPTTITKGMSKEAVLVARGYPPVHGTASTSLNAWKYWEDSGTTTIITFANNKVVSVSR